MSERARKSYEVERSSLRHFPRGPRWEFDASVAHVFPDMLRRSIPEFGAMRELTWRLAMQYLIPTKPIVDLGASVGGASEQMMYRVDQVDRFPFVLIEHAPAMLDILRMKFRDRKNTQIVDFDLAGGYRLPSCTLGASAVLSVLTLQFVPVERRQAIIADIYDSLALDGAFFFVEKCEVGGELGRHMQDEYRAHKRRSGYSEAEIEAKARALEGVLVPLSAKTNEAMLRAAGFSHVESYWRAGLFCGWIAIK